ncbi:DUF6114 domain-containing protein [Bacillus sp. FJAT-49736]|uniref:DUF6114 domain-containing protein n=1 Tax=Bacillus sp. FJAT-49736 TaxID=2833582 RepID=UPI001BC97DE7|nr:DUF6114 domain-containing protein [Bacillus sp. FJAT-49736]MBS4174545.1 hypothetical protein [Bacillus sp. FJAT-49736]
MRQSISKRQRFKNWRMSRPFWGATLSLLAGIIILYIPIQLMSIAFAPGNLVVIGLIFGGLIILIGALGYFFPKFNIVFGVITIFLSVLSVMGALGGFLIGTILGIIGGSLSIAWKYEIIEPNQNMNEISNAEVAASSVEVERKLNA